MAVGVFLEWGILSHEGHVGGSGILLGCGVYSYFDITTFFKDINADMLRGWLGTPHVQFQIPPCHVSHVTIFHRCTFKDLQR